MRISRRAFLGSSASAVAASQLPFVITRPARASVDFGPLVPDPNGIIDLSEGFRYVVLETAGDFMSDGLPMRALPDGMACFWSEDGAHYVLARNHEVDEGPSMSAELSYDNNRAGGVSRIVVDPATLQRVSSNWLLTGTGRNCAGGADPLGLAELRRERGAGSRLRVPV